MLVFMLILTAIIAYALGGINGSIIASKYIFRRDIRDFGSGNAGLTNFYRTFGAVGAILVIAIDVLKSVIAVVAGGLLLNVVEEPTIGRIFACFCLMLGHAYPAYYNFKGGKGVLCAGVAALFIDWRIGLICWAVFIVVAILTRYISLSSIVCCLFLPIGVWLFKHGGIEGAVALFCALLLIFQHRDNIARLIAGKEPRFDFSTKPKQPFEE